MAGATGQIHLRAATADKRLLAKAARLTGRRNVTEYIMSTVMERARIDLADHPRFTLANADFRRFLATLDSPPRFLPGLRKLLDRPAIFDPAPPHGIQDRAAVPSARR